MAINVLKRFSGCKVAPLLVHDDFDGLGRQRCPEELFRARRGFEQCKLNFLTTVVDNWDGQVVTRGLYSEPVGYPVKTNKTSDQNSLELNRNGHASVGQTGKPRKFRPRKILRKLVGNRGNKVQPASG